MQKELSRQFELDNPEKTMDQSQFFEKIKEFTENFLNHNSKIMINIAGQSAVGKSTIAERIKQVVNKSVAVINMDNYLLGWDVGLLNHDSGIPERPYFAGLNPKVYDLSQLKSDLQKIYDGQEVDMPWFNKTTGRRGGFNHFSPSSIMVLDGIYSLDDEFRSYADLSILVEASLHDRLIRKIFRNSVEHLESIDSIINTYLTRDEPTYSYHSKRLTTVADWILLNPTQLTQKPIITEVKNLPPTSLKKNILLPKSGNGKLQTAEELSITFFEQEIFIQYIFNGNVLFFSPINKTTFELIKEYYRLEEEK